MSSLDEAQALVTAVQAWADRLGTPVCLVVGTEPPIVLECGDSATRQHLRSLLVTTPKEADYGYSG